MQADDGNPTANVKPTVPVVVSVVAQPPTITPLPDWTIDANESLTVRIRATDPAGAALTYSATVEGGAPVTVSVAGGLLNVRPARDYTGTFRVDLTASNGLASATTSFDVSVVVPVLAPVADRAVDVGPLSITLAGSDPAARR